MTNAWGGGYVTDTNYLPGWYGQQSPMHLATTCLLMGVACDLPSGNDPVHYMELGCGLGFGAMVLAASNPAWRVTGIDFNPAHIALARSAARDAGLMNVDFVEADLATLDQEEVGRQIPQADFVSLHGVWSWVSEPIQAGILRLLRTKVRAGGVVHVSYNALPAWQGAMGLQKVMALAGDGRSVSSSRRVHQAAALVRDLVNADAMHLKGSPYVRRVMETIDDLPSAYLAHEYLNESWNPCFHADVAEAMSGAKLDWVGSASLPENFASLMLTDAQRVIYDRTDDPRVRELIKDVCLQRGLRHDVYVRGAQTLRPSVRDAALNDLWLALAIASDVVTYEVELASGVASISPEFYGPMIAAMAKAPCRVGDLLAMADVAHRQKDPREVVGILAGAGYAIPAARPGFAPQPAAVRFNRMAARWLAQPETLGRPLAAASVALGAGLPATAIDLFVQDRLHDNDTRDDVAVWCDALGAGAGEDVRRTLRDALTRCLDQRVPLMRAAGVM